MKCRDLFNSSFVILNAEGGGAQGWGGKATGILNAKLSVVYKYYLIY